MNSDSNVRRLDMEADAWAQQQCSASDKTNTLSPQHAYKCGFQAAVNEAIQVLHSKASAISTNTSSAAVAQAMVQYLAAAADEISDCWKEEA